MGVGDGSEAFHFESSSRTSPRAQLPGNSGADFAACGLGFGAEGFRV